MKAVILDSQVRSLDTAIQSLDAQISASKSPRVNESFKESWRAFTSRWAIQRDAWLSAGDITRKFGFSEDTYEQFKSAYQRWLADYQKRIVGVATKPPPAVAPTPSQPIIKTPLFGNLFAGSGTALLLTALLLGGVYIIYTKKGKSNG